MNAKLETEKKEIGEKEMIGEKIITVEEEIKKGDVTVIQKVKEKLDITKDAELGEFNVSMIGKFALRWTLYGHKNKDGSIIFYVYFFIVKEGIQEVFRVINKKTAITMLSRLKLSEEQEQRIKEHLSNFEIERERIQLHDRLTDYEQILTDEDIEKQIDKVQYFHFFGQHGVCKRSFPHPPHVLGFYSTIRYGNLPVFCTGVPGTLILNNGKKVKLEITKDCKEDCYGRYIFFELLEE